MRSLALILVALAACRAQPLAPGSAEDLAAYLSSLAGADAATREREVAAWVLPEAAWTRTVVAPYRPLYAEYVRAFEAARPELVAQLAVAAPVTARRHFAGDRRLTLAEARLRWAVPVLYPSMVAEHAGTPIDAVFVHDGSRWRALAGLDSVVLAHVRALDPACAELLAHAGPPGRCTEVGWVIADAALRSDHKAFTHACLLAAPHCGNGSP